jgi:SAM-dependent methyltransferase
MTNTTATTSNLDDEPAGAPQRRRPTKPDLGDGISHPARFTDALLPVFAEVVAGFDWILDPFAGTGKIHQLADYGHHTIGIELEPEWAKLHPHTFVGDATDLTFPDNTFDAIVTSPTYGNRLADHHRASDPEHRRSYTHDLGRDLHPNNTGAMQWGPAYRQLHSIAWSETVRVLRPGGRLVLNIKDHIRRGELQLVSHWHVDQLAGCGLELNPELSRSVDTPGLRVGSNRNTRTPAELVLVFDSPMEDT